MSVDQIFTPPQIADAMVAAVSQNTPKVIADFSVGAGELLRAARRSWNRAEFLGVDVDRQTICSLKRREPTWSLFTKNFLVDEESTTTSQLATFRGAVDIVLLNPPFSYRGGSTHACELYGTELRVSPAMAFLLRSVPYLTDSGEIVALMPHGALHAEKNAAAWKVLRQTHRVEELQANGERAFAPHIARTLVIRLSKAPFVEVSARREMKRLSVSFGVGIRRGRNQLHALKDEAGPRSKAVPLLHTTSVRGGKIQAPHSFLQRKKSDVRGAAILIPRVGAPSASKIILLSEANCCLSDCLFAITCSSASEARKLFENLHANWNHIAELYTGTGAPYLTMNKLERYLMEVGIDVVR